MTKYGYLTLLPYLSTLREYHVTLSGVLQLVKAQVEHPPLPSDQSTEEGVVEKKFKMSTDDHITGGN